MLQTVNRLQVKNTLNYINKGWLEVIDCLTTNSIYLAENTFLFPIKKNIYEVISGEHKNKTVFISEKRNIQNTKETNISASIYINGDELYFKNDKLKLTNAPTLIKEQYQISYPDRPRENISKEYILSKSGSIFASTWFPISKSDNLIISHIHLGTYSEGCITVDFNNNSSESWNKLYYYLINSYKSLQSPGNMYIK